MKTEITRRRFLGASATLAAALPLASLAADGLGDRKLKVICVGGHPDDPESGCAGTLTRVSSGVVAVRAGKKTVLVRAGKRYLARPR